MRFLLKYEVNSNHCRWRERERERDGIECWKMLDVECSFCTSFEPQFWLCNWRWFIDIINIFACGRIQKWKINPYQHSSLRVRHSDSVSLCDFYLFLKMQQNLKVNHAFKQFYFHIDFSCLVSCAKSSIASRSVCGKFLRNELRRYFDSKPNRITKC